MKKVMIGVPCQSGQVSVEFTNSLLLEFIRALGQNIIITPMYYTGGSILPLARNAILSEFFASDFDDLVFIDSDQGWEPGAVCKIVSHPVDLVGGAVRLKKDEEQYAVAWKNEKELWADKNGLIEVDGLGTGFLRISRKAATDLIAAHHHLSYSDGTTLGNAWALFDSGLENGRYYGEDMWFCKLAKKAGFKIYLDPEIKFTHVGIKSYTGTIGKWLKSR